MKDKKLNAEQAEWESKNADKAALIEEVLEEMDSEKSDSDSDQENVSPPISKQEVSEEPIEARPLPVKVRTAKKKED